jgi:hypothetical protein
MDTGQGTSAPGTTPVIRAGASRDRVLFAGLAVAAIWVSVACLSIFAPDLVTGTQQDHIPIVALLAWIGGLSATKSVVAFSRRGSLGDRWMWVAYTTGVGVVWLAVALVGIFCPDMVTGTDPTRIPIAGILAPFVGAAVTGLIGEFVAGPKEAGAPSAPAPAAS